MSARSWGSATWDRVKVSLKRKPSTSSTKSVASASSNCSQVSDDANGSIYSTLQTLFDMLSSVSPDFARDGQFSEARRPLETFLDQVSEAKKSINHSTTTITEANIARAHSALVILYDDTRLLLKGFTLYGTKRPRWDWGKEVSQDLGQRLASLQERFGEWAALYFPQPESLTDTFDLMGLMEGTTELFRWPRPGDCLRLVYDRWTRVLTTQADAPVQIKLDPKRIERLERASAQNGTFGVVTIFYHPTELGVEGKVWTVVLGQAGALPLGLWNARRLCDRLRDWNCDIGRPRWRTELDGVRWRFDDADRGGSSSSSSPAMPFMVTPLVAADGGECRGVGIGSR